MYQVNDKVRFVECKDKPNANMLAKENGLIVGEVYNVDYVGQLGGITTLYVNGVDIGFITDIFESISDDVINALKNKMIGQLQEAMTRGFNDKCMKLSVEEIELIISKL